MRYFDSEIEYPDPTADILPFGTWWEHISTTFLNGWINYVDIRSARLVTRYSSFEENTADVAGLIEREYQHFDAATMLDDDLLVLGRTKHPYISLPGETPDWWVFWFDRDCSDSGIGRFRTSDTPDDVVSTFVSWADKISMDHGGARSIEVPLKLFKGWISG